MKMKIVRPIMDFKLLGTRIVLDMEKNDFAIDATNQPDWEEEGKVFLQIESDGSPAERDDIYADGFLLSEEDYELIEDEED